ncbi:E3 ubiquitin-protein ligase RNF220 [Camelus dromedarius]|uniref:E3 ubiquitin-protein ligase RNF220 n=1 Tax=Camelus dromedarius TaxID=9838 RepID=A0A5N4DDD0_CAMDR|nr:E3 ubiquitin-protein ligase RNF220 [Camelus dromedarius]KAB1269062.1 E3 ubiquitin-protein ligase RNF220 [Camelus dromedarius]
MLKEEMPSDSLPLVGSVCPPVMLPVVLEKRVLHQTGSWTKDFQRPLQPEMDAQILGTVKGKSQKMPLLGPRKSRGLKTWLPPPPDHSPLLLAIPSSFMARFMATVMAQVKSFRELYSGNYANEEQAQGQSMDFVIKPGQAMSETEAKLRKVEDPYGSKADELRTGKKKAAALFDSQAPICPICQVLLRPSELQEHMEQELEQLAQLPASKNSLLKDAMAPGTPKSLLLSASIKREGESPTASPHSSATDDLHHSDRYQVRRGGLGIRSKLTWMRV